MYTMTGHKGLYNFCNILMDLLIFMAISVKFSSTSKSSLKSSKGSADYCLLDTFEPHCSKDEIVLIDSAIYGRTKNSRCIQHGAGQVGCFVDVKDLMASLCSGKRSCKVPVALRSLLSTRPCGDLAASLTVSYSCLKVLSDTNNQCKRTSGIKTVAEKGFISSDLASDGGPGSRSCPWKIESKSGKQLNVTIQTFLSTNPQTSVKTNPPVCFEAVTVKEKHREKKTLICPSDPNVKRVTISEGSEVELMFPTPSDGSKAFIIEFKAIGCSNPKIPQGAHSNRKGNQIDIQCNKTKASWRLTCVDNEWQGEEKDCSSAWMLSSVLGEEESPPLGMLLIIVCGIALGVLIGGFLLYLAINAFKRYHGLLPAQQIQNPSYEKPFYNPNKMAYNDRTIQRSSMIYGTNRRSYSNRQMPPPVPPPHADNAQMRPPSEISEANRQSHIYETPLFNSL